MESDSRGGNFQNFLPSAFLFQMRESMRFAHLFVALICFECLAAVNITVDPGCECGIRNVGGVGPSARCKGQCLPRNKKNSFL